MGNVCEFCETKFQTFYRLKQHKLLKHDYCQNCEVKTDTIDALVKHFVKSHPNSCYNCKECSEVFISKPRLTNHRKNVHDAVKYVSKKPSINSYTIKNYVCDICDYTFHSPSRLEQHNNARHLLKKTFECETCDFKTAWKGELSKHYEVIHKNRVWQLYQCSICGYSTKNKDHLDSHIKKKHERVRIKNHRCEVCNKYYMTEIGLKAHTSNVHGNIYYNCDICEFKSKWKHSFETHVKGHGDEDKKLQCSDCNFATHWQTVLTKHIKTNHTTSQKVVHCKPCARSFKSVFEYREHNRSIHKGKCQFCDYHTPNLLLMKKHLKHCGQDVKKFHCDQCDYKVSSNYYLGVHINKIHGREIFCKYCDFSNENRSYMVKHLERCKKSTEEMFCETCNKRFTFKTCLELHVFHKHKNSDQNGSKKI